MDLSEKEVSIGLSPKGGGEMMSPYSISDEELDRLNDRVANDDDLIKGYPYDIWRRLAEGKEN